MITGRRRWVLLVFAMLGISSALKAQATEIPRIGFLRAEAPDALFDAFREGLREVGYVDGRNAVIEQRWANGYLDRLPGLAAELVQLKVDVIVTASTPAALAAKRATTTIPIVIASSGDPVASGLVASLAHPGGNVTGQTIMLEEVAIKRLELLKEAVPSLSRVAVLWSASNPIYAPIVKDIERAAPRIGVQVRVVAVHGPDEIDSALARIKATHCDGLYAFEDPVFRSSPKVLDFAASARLPAVYGGSEFVTNGGMMSYGPDTSQMFRHAAVYVDKILKGARPGDLPIEQPTKFLLAVNLRTAKALGIQIPDVILVRADVVIR
jgi:putative tryptophan/tyrosine transport system substrate-binding protein